jgi:hypothetical protein
MALLLGDGHLRDYHQDSGAIVMDFVSFNMFLRV